MFSKLSNLFAKTTYKATDLSAAQGDVNQRTRPAAHQRFRHLDADRRCVDDCSGGTILNKAV